MTDEQIVSALLGSSTRGEAARALGLSERQLYNRLNNPNCKAILEEVTGKVLDDAIALAEERLAGAVDVIVQIMNDDTADAKTRLAAAESLVRSTARLFSIHEQRESYDIDRAWL